MKTRALRFALPPLAFVFAIGLRAQNALPSTNPFAGPAGVAASDAPQETIEFAGVSTFGQKVDLIFQDKATKKTTWVPLGGKADGIEVVNYDAKKEQVVARINGTQKTLTLRKSTAANAGTPAPVAPMPTGFNVPPPAPMPAVAPSGAPGAPAAPPTGASTATPSAPATPMTETQKQEQEARMLVSDLLEIGMAQRKAYEEAQRKAQEGGSTAPVTSPSATTLPAPGTVIPATSATATTATSATPSPAK